MSKTVITKNELHVPTGAIIQVAEVLLENEVTNEIIGTDADEDTIILEVQYEKDQRKVIHEVEDIISDFLDEADEEDEEDDE